MSRRSATASSRCSTARDQPLELAAILDEPVLRRQRGERGDRAVMHAQLQHPAEASELPNVYLAGPAHR